MTDEITIIKDCIAQCRAQFAFYADEHRKAGKLAKAATNQRYVTMVDRALAGVEAQVSNPAAWFVADSVDAEWWCNGGKDRDEAIAIGRDRFAGGDSFWIVEAKRQVPNLTGLFDGMDIVDRLQEDEAWGEDGWEGAGNTDELERRLTVTLQQWFAETCSLDGAQLDFVHGPEEIRLT